MRLTVAKKQILLIAIVLPYSYSLGIYYKIDRHHLQVATGGTGLILEALLVLDAREPHICIHSFYYIFDLLL